MTHVVQGMCNRTAAQLSADSAFFPDIVSQQLGSQV